MYVLIADDEPLARSTLKSMLGELDLPVEIVGEAGNGNEMVEKVKATLPDVAFVDIRMPEMNGLEAIRVAKTISPQTKWIILTGFSEFEFAQQAVRLEASDYLLKPVAPENLKNILTSIQNEQQQQYLGLNKRFERDLLSFYSGLSLDLVEADSLFNQYCFNGAVFFIDSSLPQSVKAEKLLNLSRNLYKQKEQLFGQHLRSAILVSPEGNLMITIAWNPNYSGRHLRTTDSFFRGIEGWNQKLSEKNLKITAICSVNRLSFLKFKQEMDELQTLAHFRSVLGIGIVWNGDELRRLGTVSGMAVLGQSLLNLAQAYQEADYQGYQQVVETLRKLFVKHPVSDPRIRQAIAVFLHISLGIPMDTHFSTHSLLEALKTQGETLLVQIASIYKQQYVDWAAKVCAIVEKHYMDDIGIGKIAEQLYVTPNYLSSIFRQKTGITFMEYLTRIRMLKAKELLLVLETQVQQVAKQVGYSSSRHFSRLFKEFTGLYPSEFQEKYRK